MTKIDHARLSAPARLEALHASGLLDSPPDGAFDRLTRLAGRVLGAPAALMSLIDADRQVLKSAQGLPEPWSGSRQMPLSHSFCKHVVAGAAPLAIDDARTHPLTGGSPAIRDLNMIAYLGVPLLAPDGEVLGALCVVDFAPRAWSDGDLRALADVSQAVMSEMAARLFRRASERAETMARATEARTAEILESIDEAFYALDRDWRFIYANRKALQAWGRSPADLIGRSAFEAFPAFAFSESHRAHERAMATGEPQRIETHSTVLDAPVEINVFPSPSGLSVYFRNVSERRRMELMLRERDEILTLAERSAGIGVWDIDLPTNMARGTAQFFRIMGLEPTDSAVPLETLRAIRHPEDRARVVEGFRQAVMSGRDIYEMEYRILRPDGQVKWIFGRGRVVRDAAGTPVRYSGIDIDITERKRAEERLKLLAAEVDHRAKNMLAVVQAMLRLTRAETVPAFIEAFEGRLQALSGAHMLLSESKWEGAELGRLAAQELAPYRSGDARVEIDGPLVLLEPTAAQAVAMALHELATNAAKYGALSAPGGRVELTWSLGATELALRWCERGGPPVRAPTRRGLGTTVIERSIRDQLGGEARLDWRAEGLACEMTIPVDGRAHAPSAA